MNAPTKPGFYPYRKPGTNRLTICFVTRGGNGKLYAILLKHRGWKAPRVYPVGVMGGEWYARILVKRKKVSP